MYDMTAPAGVGKLQPSTGTGPGRCVMESGRRMCRAMTLNELAAMITNLGQIARSVANSPAAAAAGLANAAANAGADWLVDRPVKDKTGITGRFDFAFDYGRSPAALAAPPVRVVDSLAALGLRLEPAKNTVQTITIEKINRLPTPN